jgi:hypothetical protein
VKNNIASFLVLGAGLLASALATPAGAAIPVGPDGKVQVGGFFSQGYLHSSDNNYPTANKGGTWDFREMAVNVSTTFGSRLRIGGQAFAQRFGNLGEDKVILDWAVADYNVSPLLGFRVGRVKYPKGLYGEALDLDVVRPYVFLPNAVYSLVMRDFSAAFNGAMVYGSFSAGKGSLDYKAFYGDIPMSQRQGVADFYGALGLYPGTGPTRLGMESVYGGQLVWNTPLNGLKFVYSYSQFNDLETDGPLAPAPMFNAHSAIEKFSWNTISAEYLWGNWTFASEFQRCEGDVIYGAPPVVPSTRDIAGWDGWYVAAARRFKEKYEIGVYYGGLVQVNDSRGRSFPGNHQYDTAISLRCDLNEHVTIKAEYHWIEGSFQTFDTARLPNPVRKSDNNVFAVKTTLSF